MELETPVSIPDRMFFRIGEVADIVGVKPYVLRYWESEFSLLSPNKSNSQQRMYSRTDVENALLIKHLLYDLRFSIEGAKKRIAEMRRQGELSEARKVKVVVEAETLDAIAQAKRELKDLIELCSQDQ
ncbi:MAG: MerR family transcriptional regulator [Deltaproteobacteria bacterium]|nr:MerR family transcriptional regulator [Deltaproteobacteria bacterium]